MLVTPASLFLLLLLLSYLYTGGKNIFHTFQSLQVKTFGPIYSKSLYFSKKNQSLFTGDSVNLKSIGYHSWNIYIKKKKYKNIFWKLLKEIKARWHFRKGIGSRMRIRRFQAIFNCLNSQIGKTKCRVKDGGFLTFVIKMLSWVMWSKLSCCKR